MARFARTVAMLLFLAVFAAAGWLAYRGVQARSHLEAAADGVAVLQRQVRDLDAESARDSASEVRRNTARAQDLTADPVWRVASRFPWGGQNLAAVTDAAAAVDALAADGLPGLVEAVDAVSRFRDGVEDGTADPTQWERAGAGMVRLEEAIDRSRADLEAIDRSYTVRAVSRAVDELLTSLDLAAVMGEDLGARLQSAEDG